MPEPRKVNRMIDGNTLVFGFMPIQLLFPLVSSLFAGAVVINTFNAHPLVGLVVAVIIFTTWSIVTYEDNGKRVKARRKSVPKYAGGTRKHKSLIQELHDEDEDYQNQKHRRPRR